MITIDLETCTRCGVCMSRFRGYCVENAGGSPKIDYSVCNQCQKCVAICPSRAIRMNGALAERMSGESPVKSPDLKEFLGRRRSCKLFRPDQVPREVLEEIASAAALAPNQNKNIELVAVDDPAVIAEIDAAAMKAVRRWHRLLFSVKPLTRFCGLFSKSLGVIRRKMERDLFINKRIVKENTACLFLAVGDAKVPVTEGSAQYLLAWMTVYAESLDVSSCVMDSVKHFVNQSGKLKRSLGIPKGWKVLGVLAVGYSGEHIVNVPSGYAVKVSWNSRSPFQAEKLL